MRVTLLGYRKYDFTPEKGERMVGVHMWLSWDLLKSDKASGQESALFKVREGTGVVLPTLIPNTDYNAEFDPSGGEKSLRMSNELTLYTPFIKEIKELIYRRQYEAMKKVNTELMQLYWEIGGEIERKQQEQGWGKSIVELLAKELQKEFPGIQGFSARNLWRMRNFYLEYSQIEILPPSVAELDDEKNIDKNLKPITSEMGLANLPPLVAEISWTKNYAIMEKCKDPLERIFYIKTTRRFGWTKDVLINNIENKAYETVTNPKRSLSVNLCAYFRGKATSL